MTNPLKEEESNIYLLCPSCLKSMTNSVSETSAIKAVLANPVALQRGFDRRRLPFVSGTSIPAIDVMADVQMRSVPVPIVFCASPVIELMPPETAGGPSQISIFLGIRGQQPSKIVASNEWRPQNDSWKFEWRGERYWIESRDQDAYLVVAMIGPERLRIDAVRTWCRGKVLEIDRHQATVDGLPVALRSCQSEIIGTQI